MVGDEEESRLSVLSLPLGGITGRLSPLPKEGSMRCFSLMEFLDCFPVPRPVLRKYLVTEEDIDEVVRERVEDGWAIGRKRG